MIWASCGDGSARTGNYKLSRSKQKHLLTFISFIQSQVDMYVSDGLIQLKINGVQVPTDLPYTSNSGKRLIFRFCLIFADLLRRRGHDPANTSQDNNHSNLRRFYHTSMQAFLVGGKKDEQRKRCWSCASLHREKKCRVVVHFADSRDPQNKHLDDACHTHPWWLQLFPGQGAVVFYFPASLLRFFKACIMSPGT